MAKRYFLLKTDREPSGAQSTGPLRVEGRPAPGLVIAGTTEGGEVSSVLSELPEGVFLLGELRRAPLRSRLLVEAGVTAGLLAVGVGFYVLPGIRSDIRAFISLLILTPAVVLSAVWSLGGVLRDLLRAILRPSIWRSLASVLAFGFGAAGVVADEPRLVPFILLGGVLAAVRPVLRLLPWLTRTTLFGGVVPLGGGYAVRLRGDSGKERPVPLNALSEGDMVVFDEQEMIPVECVVAEGEGEISYGGFPSMKKVGPGTALHPGASMCKGRICARVVKVPEMELAEASTRLRIIRDGIPAPAAVLNLITVMAVTTVLVSMVMRVRFAGMMWAEALVFSAAAAAALPLEAPSILFSLYQRVLVDAAVARGLYGSRTDYLEAPDAVLLETRFPLEEESVPVTVQHDPELPGDILGRLVTGGGGRSIFIYPPRSGRAMEGLMLLSGEITHAADFLSRALQLRRRLLLSTLFSLLGGGAAAALAAVGLVDVYHALAVMALAVLWSVGILALDV